MRATDDMPNVTKRSAAMPLDAGPVVSLAANPPRPGEAASPSPVGTTAAAGSGAAGSDAAGSGAASSTGAAKPAAADIGTAAEASSAASQVFAISNLSVYYGSFLALRDVNMEIMSHQVTAFIGPSGCGKSTYLRCFNRMNDLIETARVEGDLRYHDVDLYDAEVDPVEVRRRIGMVFQKPNPFPKSVFDNVAYGARLGGLTKSEVNDVVERSLQRAALWDEVKDRLKAPAYGLSGGQQQRLCIARAIAVEPDVLLMDEPCSSLDPIATSRIEELVAELKNDYTILVVTHNMQQAARISDQTAFFSVNPQDDGARTGELVEFGQTSAIFTNPEHPSTEAYITGRMG